MKVLQPILSVLILSLSTIVSSNTIIGGRHVETEEGFLSSWPGTYYETRFTGSKIGIKVKGQADYFNVEIDKQFHSVIQGNDGSPQWIENLGKGTHDIRLSKRTESHYSYASFQGFAAAKGEKLLPLNNQRTRMIEIIGDSNFAGYGNESSSRECTEDENRKRSNADKTFSVLTARYFNADYQLNGYSGQGMVRNWGGNLPDVNYRIHYQRTLTEDPASVYTPPQNWKPEIVLIGLGSNDFSVAVTEKEKWTNVTLHKAYKKAYLDFYKKLRKQYGSKALFILASQPLAGSDYFNNLVAEIVKSQEKKGDNIVHWEVAVTELTGCQWHYSLNDHLTAYKQLVGIIEENKPEWKNE